MWCRVSRPNTWTHPTGAHRYTKALAPQGSFSNRVAFVKPCCSYFARVTVLYAVGIGRRNIWFGPEAQGKHPVSLALTHKWSRA